MDVPIIGGDRRPPSENQRLNVLRGLAREMGVEQPEREDGLVVAKASDVPKARRRRARRN